VGRAPGWSDILPYTDAGIVLLNESQGAGHAQMHLQLHHGQLLYASVRAHLGKLMYFSEYFTRTFSDKFTLF
jgi:hypothetical protein